MKKVREWSELIRHSTERAFYGKGDLVEKLLVALLCRGQLSSAFLLEKESSCRPGSNGRECEPSLRRHWQAFRSCSF